MRSLARFAAACASLVAAAACSPAPSPVRPPPPPPMYLPPPHVVVAPPLETPDAPFRAGPPAPGPDVVFAPPKIDGAKLSNGVPVLLVERHGSPIVSFAVVFRRGAEVGPPGLGAFTAAMLLSGTKTRSALQISDAFEALGAEYGSFADYDATTLSAKVLAPSLERALELVADCVEHPSFPKEELERERSRRLNAIAEERDRPAALLTNAIAYTLYPKGHPYKFSLLGTEASVRRLSRDELGEQWRANLTPDRATLVVAGDVTQATLMPMLEKAFGKWKGNASPAVPPAAPPAPGKDEPRVVIVDRPGASQTNVAVADVGVPRLGEDTEAIWVMNAILGGKFSSRLNMNLREKHAYTYGAGSSFDMRHGPGPFRAGAAVVRESTVPAVKEILAELARIRTEKVTDAELADAKGLLVQALPARFETVSETVSALSQLAIYGLPLDEYATRAARIAKVSADDVLRVAGQAIRDDRLRVVLVGDAATFRDGIMALGRGPVEELGAPKGAPEKRAAADGKQP